ncbi:MAG: uroporphyrinogen-III C-methyltransferase [Verrucomicrobiales bacterium]|jgi:uroporphyrinogen III methyltransferase/synthase|nr:uroporphyrinogen-III C-methyltransferase [Verrucomicrobiales bacterium]
MNQPGICYLTGGGPGHPGLLTVRAVEVLRRAEVVVYDNLINEAVLSYAPPSAERVYVGKRAGRHEWRQADINRLLVDLTGSGKAVVRLKGGDPFVLGRGGEEAGALAAAGLRFEVIPGVTSGLAAAAFAGIPVTLRGHAGAVVLVTGHDCPMESGRVDWAALAALRETTLVIYMGVRKLPAIVSALLAAGKDPATPSAAVQWGTRPAQRVVTAALRDLPPTVSAAKLSSPAVIIIGDVAALAGRLDWFKPGPLSGRRCLITRTREQNGALRRLLEARGADVVELPMIELKPLPVTLPVSLSAAYRWLVFTSPNGVEYFFRHWHADRDIRELGGVKIAAVGAATRARLRALGLRVDFTPTVYTAEALCAEWPDAAADGRRVLHVRGNLARDSVVARLARIGWPVDPLTVYETTAAPGAAGRYHELLFAAPPDWVIFCSASSARQFRAVAGGELPAGLKIASLGRVTSAAARAAGWTVDLEASKSRLEVLVEELVQREQIPLP